MILDDGQVHALAQAIYEFQANRYQEIEAATAPPAMVLQRRAVIPLSQADHTTQQAWRDTVRTFLEVFPRIAFDPARLREPNLIASRRRIRAAATSYDLTHALLISNKEMTRFLFRELTHYVAALQEE